jgi:hypothetical protein
MGKITRWKDVDREMSCEIMARDCDVYYTSSGYYDHGKTTGRV